jgi:hypothetical protein
MLLPTSQGKRRLPNRLNHNLNLVAKLKAYYPLQQLLNFCSTLTTTSGYEEIGSLQLMDIVTVREPWPD